MQFTKVDKNIYHAKIDFCKVFLDPLQSYFPSTMKSARVGEGHCIVKLLFGDDFFTFWRDNFVVAVTPLLSLNGFHF